MSATFHERVLDLVDRAAASGTGADFAAQVAAVRRRLTGPLRVAIAGRVKAGKSTLLNALVSERLAPTDAGECTMLVSEYREDLTYDVTAVLKDGERRALRFRRDGDTLDVDLGALSLDEVAHLDVGWPSSALRTMTLIDTPGLASMTEASGRRTLDYLGSDDDTPGQADAVLYLMRHLHRTDASFLETFSDRSLANASPVNAVAVLSRADEIGAGRGDAMDSASRIAARYAGDRRVQALASQVVPMAGLLAETGLTLRQEEFGQLAELAKDPDLDELVVSVDRFVDPDRTRIAPEIRSDLLGRLGMFGARRALQVIADGTVRTAPELSRHLVELSGLPALRAVLEGHFQARADALKGRAALVALRQLVRTLPDDHPDRAGLLHAIEEVESTSAELGELRLVHLVLAGATTLTEEERAEVQRVTGAGDPARRLGLPATAEADAIRAAALSAVDRWRTRRAHPMIDPTTAEACDLLARAYEGIHAQSMS